MAAATLYDTGEMSIGGKRERAIVTKTAKGITVKFDSLYSDVRGYTAYYRDGNYPKLPANWDAVVSDYMATAAKLWFHELEGYDADKITH